MELNKDTLKIKIYGAGGMGVRYFARKFGECLMDKYGYKKMSIYSRYDSAMKNGHIEVNLALGKNKDVAPFFQQADMIFYLNDFENFIGGQIGFIYSEKCKSSEIIKAKVKELIEIEKLDLNKVPKFSDALFAWVKKNVC